MELEVDRAIIGGGKEGGGGGGGSHGIRVGDIVRVAEQPKASERRREKSGMEKGGVEGVVVRSRGAGVEVAVGEQVGGGEGDVGLEGGMGMGGRLWV